MLPVPAKHLYAEAFGAALSLPGMLEYIKNPHICFITAIGLISGVRASVNDTGAALEIIRTVSNSIDSALEKMNTSDSEQQNFLEIKGNAIALKDVTISSGAKTYHLDSMLLFTDDIIGITCMSGDSL